MHDLQTNRWYWIRRDDGSLAAYRFHRTVSNTSRATGRSDDDYGEFYVGSMLQTFPLGRVVGEARMPRQ